MAGYRVLDIETVVDDRFWDRPKSKWSLYPSSPLAASQLQLVEEEPFPPPQAHRVVAMAWVDLSGDDNRWYTVEKATCYADWGYGVGADVVERVLLEKFKEAQEGDEACLVTWNGRTFDLPVINLRSFLHKIATGWYYKERDLRYRYSEACHCDLMDFFSDYGAARSMKLGDVAKLAGLPGKIGEVTGGSVGEIYKSFQPRAGEGGIGELAVAPELHEALVKAKAAVGAYCLLDAMQTAFLFARSRLHKGMIDLPYYDQVVVPSFDEPLSMAVAAVRGVRS